MHIGHGGLAAEELHVRKTTSMASGRAKQDVAALDGSLWRLVFLEAPHSGTDSFSVFEPT